MTGDVAMAMNSIRSVVDVHSVGMDETSLQWMMLTALRRSALPPRVGSRRHSHCQ